MTKFRKVTERLLPVGSFRRDFYWTVLRISEVLLDGGPVAVCRKIQNRFRIALNVSDFLPRAPGNNEFPNVNKQYGMWLSQHQITPADIERMRSNLGNLTYHPHISIVMPVYNTEEDWLRRAVESVEAQIYQNWELCIVNDASTNSHIKTILDAYAIANSRIRVKHLTKRLGIAGASAEALEMVKGDFVGLLDHDDEITPDALSEVVNWLNRNPQLDLLYSDEDKLNSNGARVEPFFKPDWSPDLLLSMNYIAHFSVFRRSFLQLIGGFRSGYEGAQDYDLLLRFTERSNRIAHIPKILYHWRMDRSSSAHSAAAKPYAFDSGRRAIEDALQRRQCEGTVKIACPGKYAVRYSIKHSTLVSVIIPTKDQLRLIRQCIASVEEKTNYLPYEIIIIDNNSTDPETIQYLHGLSSKHRVLRYPEPFNFSIINNFAASHAKGEYLVFLNDDTQVLEADWLKAMVEQAQRPEIGAVGAKLLYPNNCIQHAGVIVGLFGEAGHAFRSLPDNRTAYCGFADVVRNCSAVTAACMMIRRQVFQDVGGFDEALKVVYNDVDLCLRLRQRGYLIVYTPFAVLRHFESATRGRVRPAKEEELFCRRWHEVIRRGDPYYNPNLSLTREDWSLRL